MGVKRKELICCCTPNATNNGAVTYHKNLKSKIKTHRPNIWSFLDSLEEIYTPLEYLIDVSSTVGKQTHVLVPCGHGTYVLVVPYI